LALAFWKKMSSKRQRIITIIVFFLIGIIVTCIGTLAPLSQQEAQQINQDLENLRSNVSVQYIFGNNLLICLVMFVPIVGPIFGLYALYNTGVVVEAQVVAGSSTGISPILLFFLLFLFPFTWLEFISYSTAFAESVWILRRFTQGLGRREIKNAAFLIAIVTILLLIGAIIETVLIQAMGG
jgi:membrane protease YdiL (CAAX protease family)